MQHNLLIVPFEPWHLTVLDIRDEQKKLVNWFSDQYGSIQKYGSAYLNASASHEEAPCAWSVMLKGKPILCGGIYALTPYMGEAWTIVSNDFTKADLCVKMDTVREIKDIIKKVDLQRIQANTEVTFKDAQRFLKMLGFVEEGVAKAYTPFKEDSVMYGLVREV